MPKPFVHLHNHSDFSLLDGAQKCHDLAERCKALGHAAVAQTDHGTMRGFYKFHVATSEVGIKPIYGMEAYLCKDRHRKGLTPEEQAQYRNGIAKKREQNAAVKEAEMKLGIRARQHACFFAKDNDGLRNLFRLSSIGWLEGFYYRPRIDYEAVARHAQGVIMSTACTSGVLAAPFAAGDMDEMVRVGQLYKALFGEDLYLEIMPHQFDEQVDVNLATVELAGYLGCKLIATNDAHYSLKSQSDLHDVLLCMQSKDVWSNPKRWHFTGRDFYLKDREEMEESFRLYHPSIPREVYVEALDNTLEVAEKCNAKVTIDRKQCLLPPVEIDPDHFEEFMEWCAETYPEHYTGPEAELPNVPCAFDTEAPSAADAPYEQDFPFEKHAR